MFVFLFVFFYKSAVFLVAMLIVSIQGGALRYNIYAAALCCKKMTTKKMIKQIFCIVTQSLGMGKCTGWITHITLFL